MSDADRMDEVLAELRQLNARRQTSDLEFRRQIEYVMGHLAMVEERSTRIPAIEERIEQITLAEQTYTKAVMELDRNVVAGLQEMKAQAAIVNRNVEEMRRDQTAFLDGTQAGLQHWFAQQEQVTMGVKTEAKELESKLTSMLNDHRLTQDARLTRIETAQAQHESEKTNLTITRITSRERIVIALYSGAVTVIIAIIVNLLVRKP